MYDPQSKFGRTIGCGCVPVAFIFFAALWWIFISYMYGPMERSEPVPVEARLAFNAVLVSGILVGVIGTWLVALVARKTRRRDDLRADAP